MSDDQTIRRMQVSDLAFAAQCTADEKWASETWSTSEGFYRHDPNGCLLAEYADHRVGICVATSYGHCGFIGELIVRPEVRGKGVGAALLNHANGFILGRRGKEWAAAGPWVLAEAAREPIRLLESLAYAAGNVSTLSVGVLETNPDSVELIRSLGFTLREDSPWRMALGPSSDLGASPQCLAVGTAATG